MLAVAVFVMLGSAAIAAAAVAPSIESEGVSNITLTDATLETQIDSGELETTYEFKLETASCRMANPVPNSCESVSSGEIGGTVPASSSPQMVSINIAKAWHDLSPNTTYFYSVRAANSAGNAYGNDKSFRTPAGVPPSIEGESASNITPTDATLEAQINLHEAGPGAYYQFQLATDPSEYASEILCPPTLQPGTDGCIGPQASGALPIGLIPGNTLQPGTTRSASVDLASVGVTLQPGTTYHFRVLVARRVQTEDTIEWEPPTVYGADQIFTTAVEPAPIPLGIQSLGGDGQATSAIQSPPAASPSHRKPHRRHKRGLHRSSLHRASHTG
jgi:hypothetical protein